MDDLDEREFWPPPDEPLFVPNSDDPQSYAWVSGATWYHYAKGYQRAARCLVDEAESIDGVRRSSADFLVFPAVFLYRQHLELQMKELVEQGELWFDLEFKLGLSHRLEALWKACRTIVLLQWPSTPHARLDAIEAQVHELAEIDPTSTTFRYPTNRDGSTSIPEELRYFSLKLFADRIERIGSWLDSASTGIYHENDERLDAQAMMRDQHDEYSEADYY